MEMSGKCPICEEMYAESSPPKGRTTLNRCRRCGDFILTATARSTLEDLLKDRPNGQTLLSYTIRKMQGKEPPTLDYGTIKAILENSRLPSLKEQENNLVLYLGTNRNAGELFGMESIELIGVVGSINYSGLNFIINHLKQSGLVTVTKDSSDREYLMLTMKGWERYEEIRRGNIDSKKAFMAMPFGNPTLDEVYKHFKVAVGQTGFDLRRIDEGAKAGLIDDRLRVEITTSRFLIAELTEENRGVYWEAGFAEGLGRPVIYTCEKAHFKQQSTHFDTNHHLTVQWEADKIDEALDELKATIRATLPDEAKLQD
jgi:DNA-binding MarR family transcriptional regulator